MALNLLNLLDLLVPPETQAELREGFQKQFNELAEGKSPDELRGYVRGVREATEHQVDEVKISVLTLALMEEALQELHPDA